MKASLGFRQFIALVLGVALTADGIALSQQPSGTQPGAAVQGELRWTPHRAATTTPSEPAPVPAPATTVVAAAAAQDGSSALAPAATATPAASTPGGTAPSAAAPGATAPGSSAPLRPATPVAPPATVGLPADVPSVTPPRRPATQNPAAARRSTAGAMGDWNSANRTSGRFRSTGLDASRFPFPTVSDLQVFRTPQGESGRPMLAAEGGQRRPAAAPVAPLGGGLAPRFNPQGGEGGRTADRPATTRPERLALNADALPSVMAKAPQAAVLQDATAPNRLPAPTGGPAQNAPTIAAPRTPSSGEPSLVIDTTPTLMGEPGLEGYDPGMMAAEEPMPESMWMGEYPTEMHVESFYDDQFACEEGPWLLPCCPCDGRICAWLRQFGKPYYGWRWYRDFTASVGITSFQNQSNLGLLGNYGTNEYLNWAMPFWNAFGIGWQIGARGVQSNFQQPTIDGSKLFNSRDQVFVTTGFFTRAFEGRGLQGGAVYDYLSDSYIENVDVAQIRGEISYVWGYHELGFWGAFNTTDQLGLLPRAREPRLTASTINLYTAFYRLHFGDANEARIWGGASDNGQGVVGATIRAPMSRSLALESAFTYLLPDKSQTVLLENSTVTFAPSAWNLSANLVWYPAGRARRSLASPYRPLFDVADNGSMIRAISRSAAAAATGHAASGRTTAGRGPRTRAAACRGPAATAGGFVVSCGLPWPGMATQPDAPRRVASGPGSRPLSRTRSFLEHPLGRTMSDSEQKDPWASLADSLGANTPAEQPRTTPPAARPAPSPAARQQQQQKPKPPAKPAAASDWGDLASSLGLEPAAPRPSPTPSSAPQSVSRQQQRPQADAPAADSGAAGEQRRRSRDDEDFGFGGRAPAAAEPPSFADRREPRRDQPRTDSVGDEPARSGGERAEGGRDDESREGRGRRRRGRRGGRGRSGRREDDRPAGERAERRSEDAASDRRSPPADEHRDAFDRLPRDSEADDRESDRGEGFDREPRTDAPAGDGEEAPRRRRRRGRRGGRRRSRGEAAETSAPRPADDRDIGPGRGHDDDLGDEPLPAGYGVRPMRPTDEGRGEPGRRDAREAASGSGEEGDGQSSERRGRRRRRRRRGGEGSGRESREVASEGGRGGSGQSSSGGGRRGGRGRSRSGGERRSSSNLSRGRRDDFAPVSGGREEDDEGLEFLGLEEAGQEAAARGDRYPAEEDESIVESGLNTVLDVPGWVEAIGIVIAGNLDARSRSPRSGDGGRGSQSGRGGHADRPRDGRRGGGRGGD